MVDHSKSMVPKHSKVVSYLKILLFCVFIVVYKLGIMYKLHRFSKPNTSSRQDTHGHYVNDPNMQYFKKAFLKSLKSVRNKKK